MPDGEVGVVTDARKSSVIVVVHVTVLPPLPFAEPLH